MKPRTSKTMMPTQPNALLRAQHEASTFPVPLTSLIGREQETADVCALLKQSHVRLLTLLGPGGVGKTRLAIQVATEVCTDFSDGVFFVPLASIDDPLLVMPALVAVLGLRTSKRSSSAFERVQEYVQDKQLLLVLDNLEYLLGVVSLLEQLLVACPRLKLLVTSRTVLHIPGEQEFPTLPLALPDLTALPEKETLLHCASVALFVQRVQAVLPSFQLTSENARSIAAICVRLDGLPLAIELAAVRIKLFPPQTLLNQLSHRLHILTSGGQTVPERQQTLRGVLAWSYNLLSSWEKRLFCWLSVFEHGCTLEGAETVCAAIVSDASGISVLEGIASLLDKSLLQQQSTDDQEPRYVMLEIVREYGLECLAASGEMEAARQAHAYYYLILAEQAEQQDASVTLLKREHDNLHAVMHFLLEQAGQQSELALRLGAALLPFWMTQGYWSEGRTFLQHALATREGVLLPVQANALVAAGKLAFQQGDYEQAEQLVKESLSLFEKTENAQGIATARETLGTVAWNKGELTRALVLLQQAFHVYEQEGRQRDSAHILFLLAWLTRSRGEYSQAQMLLSESMKLFKHLKSTAGVADSLLLSAQLLLDTSEAPSNLVTIRLQVEESLTLFRQIADKEGIAACYSVLGHLALQQRNPDEARSWFKQSQVLHEELGHQAGIAWGFAGFATVSIARKDYTTAQEYYEKSLTQARRIHDRELVVVCLEGLASVFVEQANVLGAVRLWGAAEKLRETIGQPRRPVERVAYETEMAAARHHLGEKVFTVAWAEGQAMTLEQVLVAQSSSVTSTPTHQASTTSFRNRVSYPNGLTAREVDVLRLVAQGMTDVQVAEALIISPRTVNTHLTSIYSKIGVSSRSEATRYALEHHLT